MRLLTASIDAIIVNTTGWVWSLDAEWSSWAASWVPLTPKTVFVSCLIVYTIVRITCIYTSIYIFVYIYIVC